MSDYKIATMSISPRIKKVLRKIFHPCKSSSWRVHRWRIKVCYPADAMDFTTESWVVIHPEKPGDIQFPQLRQWVSVPPTVIPLPPPPRPLRELRSPPTCALSGMLKIFNGPPKHNTLTIPLPLRARTDGLSLIWFACLLWQGFKLY